MRTIERSSSFKRDYKREARGRYRNSLDDILIIVLIALANDRPLEPRYRDHDLGGEWTGYRECHLRPDLLMIDQKTQADILRLARLGSHSELFGQKVKAVASSGRSGRPLSRSRPEP